MCHVQLNCLTFLDIKNAMVLILGVFFSHFHVIWEKKIVTWCYQNIWTDIVKY